MIKVLVLVCVLASGCVSFGAEAVAKGSDWEKAIEAENRSLREQVSELKKEVKALKAKESDIEQRERSLLKGEAKLATREAYIHNREVSAIEKGRALYAEHKKQEKQAQIDARKARQAKYGIQK